MYGSAGTYSAGSTSVGGHVRRASIGSGGNLHAVQSYSYSGSIQSGSAISEHQWGVFREIVPLGSGSGIEADRVIGELTKGASIGSGGSLGILAGVIDFTLTPVGSGGSPEAGYLLETSVSIGSGSGLEAKQVIGTLTITTESVGSGSKIETYTREIVLEDVPKFSVTPVSGNFKISITNRDGKDVKIYRTEQHNTSNQTEIEINADTYEDPIVAGKSYRYKLAFFIDLSPQIIGQKSIYKIGKS